MIDTAMPKKTPPATELGSAIRHTREKVLHLSQEALGAALNVGANGISRWETGVNKPPVESLARLAHLAAKSDAEELRLYSEWVRMAGYPRPRLDASRAGATPPTRDDPASPRAATVEGEMARAIVDFIPDANLRLQIVLGLREAVQQWQANGEGTPPVPDQP
jgi:transcriptional regulator with XRE-family HTH domain